MAVRIPQYQERGGLNPALTPTRSVPNISTPDNAFQIAAGGLKQMAGLAGELESRERRAEAERKQLEEQDAQVWVAQQMPGFHLARETDLQEMGKQAGPGAANFARTYSDRYNEQAKLLRETAPSETAKRMLDLNLARSFEHFGMKALDYERKEAVRYNVDQDATATQTAATLVWTDPSQFEQVFAPMRAGILANRQYDEATKDKLLDELRKQTVNAAMMKWIGDDPSGALKAMNGAVTTRDPNQEIRAAAGYYVPFNLGTADERARWMQHAEQEVAKARQESQVGLQYEIQNVQAMARDGVAPTTPALPKSAFMAAYAKPEVAERQYQQYITAYKTAGQTAALSKAPSAQLLSIIQATPDPKDKDYAVKSANLNIQQAAATRILQARQADPVGYAMQTGDFAFQPVDPSKPEFVDELKKRTAALPTMAAKYGKADVLSKPEAQMLAQRLNALPADQKVAELEKLRTGLADDAVYGAVMQSLRPDSPVTALVGNIAAVGFRDNARYIAAGEDLLNPTKGDKASDGRGKFAMPKEQILQQAWIDKVGDAYRTFPEAERTAYQAFRAYYASQAAARGLNDPNAAPNDEIVRKALDAATGGVTRWKTDWFGNDTPSANVILPYGMAEDQFRDKVSAQWQAVRTEAGYPKTDVGDVGLQNTGANGEYMVMSGKSWMPGKDGRPIILRIK